jgi:hypothetical protein
MVVTDVIKEVTMAAIENARSPIVEVRYLGFI